ncbi:hypothetical protein LJR164_000788 [Phenylobacterium sp. LjRoot164]|uniref:hypothetical protein n=1 Tax=unclassified Phenylobacterium TaxID=2640670 RepID=UPI003ED0B7AC
MDYETLRITPSQLLLDPNNYRFHDVRGYKEVKQRARYQELGVQDRALALLKETTAFDLGSLTDSIRTNGYIPVEQIVVSPYDNDENGNARFLVIEGNRRAASLKILLADNAAGAVDLSEKVKESLVEIQVVVLKANEDEIDSYQRTLMAIRHVAGIREWGPYQQAKLVVEMFEEDGATLGSVAQKIGISSREVARRYRASKALRQMEEDEEFSEHAEPRLYVFFHEAVSQPKVREWLGFNDESYKAENADARRLFFELLSPTEIDGEKRQPKLTSANQQVRQLKEIVSKGYALEVLADPDKTFEQAVQAAQADIVETDEGVVERSLAGAISALRKPGLAYMEANERAKELWKELLSDVEKIKKILGQ